MESIDDVERERNSQLPHILVEHVSSHLELRCPLRWPISAKSFVRFARDAPVRTKCEASLSEKNLCETLQNKIGALIVIVGTCYRPASPKKIKVVQK